MKQNTRFRHESLQDADSIRSLLEAVTKGIAKGEVVLEDDEGTLSMQPTGLLHLKITGSVEDERNRLTIRISWQGEHELPEGKSIKVKAG